MCPGNWTWSVLKWLENSASCGLADNNVKTKLLTACRFCPDSEASPVLSGVLCYAPLFQFLACKLVCPSDACGLIVTTCIPHWLRWWQCSTFVHFCVSVSQDFTFYSKLSSHSSEGDIKLLKASNMPLFLNPVLCELFVWFPTAMDTWSYINSRLFIREVH